MQLICHHLRFAQRIPRPVPAVSPQHNPAQHQGGAMRRPVRCARRVRSPPLSTSSFASPISAHVKALEICLGVCEGIRRRPAHAIEYTRTMRPPASIRPANNRHPDAGPKTASWDPSTEMPPIYRDANSGYVGSLIIKPVRPCAISTMRRHSRPKIAAPVLSAQSAPV